MDGLRDATIDELQKAVAEREAYKHANAKYPQNECAPQIVGQETGGLVSHGAWMQRQVEAWFSDRAPTESQRVAMTNIRQAAKAFALTIVQNTGAHDDQRQALSAVRFAVMVAGRSVTD